MNRSNRKPFDTAASKTFVQFYHGMLKGLCTSIASSIR